MPDFDRDLFDPIYATDVAVDAVLTTSGDGAPAGAFPVRVIDHTAGLAVAEGARSGRITLETVKPVARMRHAALLELGLALPDLSGATLTISHDGMPPVLWNVKSYQVKPSPSGLGEIDLILVDS